jgi:hypothetical protein
MGEAVCAARGFVSPVLPIVFGSLSAASLLRRVFARDAGQVAGEEKHANQRAFPLRVLRLS